ILVLDRSASMSRTGISEQLLREAGSVYSALTENDQLSVLMYAQDVETVLSSERWARTDPELRDAMFQEVLESWQADGTSTETGTALLEALRLSPDSGRRSGQRTSSSAEPGGSGHEDGSDVIPTRIVLLTDFQRGSHLESLTSVSWPDHVTVDLRILKPLIAGNAGVSMPADDAESDVLRVRVTVSGDMNDRELHLQQRNRSGEPIGEPIRVEVSPGERRSIAVRPLDDATAVTLENDPHSFDNAVALPSGRHTVVSVGYIGRDDVNDSQSMKYYLQRVLDSDAERTYEIVDLLSSEKPSVENIRLIVVADLVPESQLTVLSECLSRGGLLVVPLKSPEVLQSIAALLPVPISASEAQVKDYVMPRRMDFSNPLLAAFSDPQFADFSAIRFWKYRQLTMSDGNPAEKIPSGTHSVSVVATFDSGDPAILDISPVVGGRMILLASGWHPADSQWAVSSRFPPLMTSLIQQAQRSQKLQDSEVPNNSDDSSEPAGSGPETPATSIVSPAESRTEPLPIGQLSALGVRVTTSSRDADKLTETGSLDQKSSPAENRTPGFLNASELEDQQKLWQTFLLIGILLLLAEGFAAWWIRMRQPAESLT
ncbi:MAG: VWA domain-containing protein, partial [Planctomyces sp.]